ncbi:MAG: thiamine pyrophosphate-dependent dehydrogenase E1 component subunit alpha [Chloroflexota bacterium]
MATTSTQASILSSQAATQFDSGILTLDQLLPMYRSMLLIRRVEESLLSLAESGKIGGAMHTAIGHEANAIGTALALRPDDYLTCTYRGHHHSLARGMGAREAIAEVLGKSDGFAKGKGGSMHFIAPEKGLMGGNGIVGAQVPHAAGMALASKMRGDGRVAITFFGDGAMYQGLMHETFNMAQKWNLPVIFYCENNRYSEMTPIWRTSSVEHLYKFVHAYGMESMQIDGNDAEAVYQGVSKAAELCRAGEGPVYIEGVTYRFAGHMAGDLETYRTKEEIDEHRKRGPLVVLRDHILRSEPQDNSTDDIEESLESIHSSVEAEVTEAVEYAQESAWPDLVEAYTDVYTL